MPDSPTSLRFDEDTLLQFEKHIQSARNLLKKNRPQLCVALSTHARSEAETIIIMGEFVSTMGYELNQLRAEVEELRKIIKEVE